MGLVPEGTTSFKQHAVPVAVSEGKKRQLRCLRFVLSRGHQARTGCRQEDEKQDVKDYRY